MAFNIQTDSDSEEERMSLVLIGQGNYLQIRIAM